MTRIGHQYSKEKKYIAAVNGISPYMEVWDDTESIVPVNLFYRLQEIVLPFFGENAENQIKQLFEQYLEDAQYQDFLNLVLHYVAQLDQMQGMTAQDFTASGEYQSIIEEQYGKSVKERFEKIHFRDRRILVRYLAKYKLGSQREMQWDAALKALFGNMQIYHEKSTEVLYVYIDSEKNEYSENLYWLVQYFFMDIDSQTTVLWRGEHFGIIDVDVTMKIDQIACI